MTMVKRYLILSVLLWMGVLPLIFQEEGAIPVGALSAQTFRASAPSQVQTGREFRLSFTVSTQQVSDFRAPQFPSAFDVLMGPSTSSQQSIQIINGRTTSSASITYTFILLPTKPGTYTIPAAHITADGKPLSSNTLKIEVSGNATQGNSGGSHSSTNGSMGNRGGNGELFIKVSANKSTVVEQEPILLTYKVYSQVQLTQLNGKMPDLKGFHTQEIPLPAQKSFKVEQLGGKTYKTVTWSQYVMFPQVTGKLTIPSIPFTGTVIQVNRNIDPFEAFFNGGSGYVETQRKIVAPSLSVQVQPLPAKPADFSLGVGTFTMKVSLDKSQVKANDPVKLSVQIQGVGNMKLLKQPVVQAPADFDHYDAKVTDKTHLSAAGVQGTITYDFLMVPRHPGNFTIPPVTFTYFDTSKREYVTLKSDSFALQVAQGKGGKAYAPVASSQEDLRLLANDIRFIRTGRVSHSSGQSDFFASPLYWSMLLLQLVAFVTLVVVFRKRAMQLADVEGRRGKRAGKVASRKLRKAYKLCVSGQREAFYDEVTAALWSYVGDKLHLSGDSLTRSVVEQRFNEQGISADIIKMFIDALDECEFQRYAPGDEAGNMNKTYDSAMKAIMEIENTFSMSSKREKKTVRHTLLIMLPLLSVLFCSCGDNVQQDSYNQLKQQADSAYVQERYSQAISLYEQLLKQGENADVYYNLAGAYYRTENITRAVLNYERALLLEPGDADIRFNLQMARQKTTDRITPESPLFIVTWYQTLAHLFSANEWAYITQGALTLLIIFVLVLLFAVSIPLRKAAFVSALLMLLTVTLSTIFAFQCYHERTHRSHAIVVSGATNVSSTPSQGGTTLFLLHQGTKVRIIDDSMQQWKEIELADGKRGWISVQSIEKI